jgi:hypothetical protein
MGKVLELVGKKFKNLTVIERHGSTKFRNATWLCKCECGNLKIASTINLKNGHTTSCGCRYRKRPYESLYNRLTNECRRRNNKLARLELTYEEFLEFTNIKECHYCHDIICWKKYGDTHCTNLDRKDSLLPYTKNNCVVCCTRCNRGKSNLFSYEEWYKMTEMFRIKI